MLSKIDVSGIVRRHLGTMHGTDSSKVSASDIAFFYGVPLVLAVSLVLAGVRIKSPDAVLTSSSILFGFLVSMYLFVLDRLIENHKRTENQNRLLKETQANVGYATLVALLLMGLVFFPAVGKSECTPLLLQGLIYFLGVNLVLALLMVIKRIDRVVDSD